MMTDEDVKKLRGVIREEVTVIVEEKLKPVSKKLDILWEQADELTKDMNEVKETLDTQTSVLKRMEAKLENHSDDIHKINKRVITLENTAGIVPPPELTI